MSATMAISQQVSKHTVEYAVNLYICVCMAVHEMLNIYINMSWPFCEKFYRVCQGTYPWSHPQICHVWHWVPHQQCEWQGYARFWHLTEIIKKTIQTCISDKESEWTKWVSSSLYTDLFPVLYKVYIASTCDLYVLCSWLGTTAVIIITHYLLKHHEDSKWKIL